MRNLFLLVLSCFIFCNARAADTVNRRPVSFVSKGYTLRGDLLVPQRAGKVPALVFLVGSGGLSSHRTNYRRMGQELLEKQLLPEGIAILYFDKRGVGLSEGRWQDADFYNRADDAKAAIDFLKTLPEIDAARIGVAGHSQGGWIAQLVAARYPQDVAFMVSLAGPTFDVRTQLTNDLQSGFLCQGLDTATAHRKAFHKAALFITVSAIAPLQRQWKQLKVIRRYDPAATLKTGSRPALFLFGENDRLVYPSWSMQRLQQLFGATLPANITCHTIAGVNHGFEQDSFCGTPGFDKPYPAEFLHIFKSWVLQHLQTSTALAGQKPDR